MALTRMAELSHGAPMRVRVSDRELTGALGAFLQRVGCEVQTAGDATLVVSVPRSELEAAARLEVELYLRVWEVLHPESPASLVG